MYCTRQHFIAELGLVAVDRHGSWGSKKALDRRWGGCATERGVPQIPELFVAGRGGRIEIWDCVVSAGSAAFVQQAHRSQQLCEHLSYVEMLWWSATLVHASCLHQVSYHNAACGLHAWETAVQHGIYVVLEVWFETCLQLCNLGSRSDSRVLCL